MLFFAIPNKIFQQISQLNYGSEGINELRFQLEHFTPLEDICLQLKSMLRWAMN